MFDVAAQLLPSSASPLERAVANAFLKASGVEITIGDLWNPDRCPTSHLDYLAAAFSVDVWDPEWSEQTKRTTIRRAILIHLWKGTPKSLVWVLEAAGYGTVRVIEGYGQEVRDGTVLRDGSVLREDPDHWAEYRIALTRAVTLAQAEQIRKILSTVAPAHTTLRLLDFTEALHLRDGVPLRDGTITRGTAA